METNFRTHVFVAPSGFSYTIREQNGEDEDILSNPRDAKDLTNLVKFIASLVIETNFTANGKLSLEDARKLPLLDKYCILLQNRIFSIGAIMEFDHTFQDGSSYTFEQDLNELLFEDYTSYPSDEELEAKPYALPFYVSYPNGDHSKLKDIPFNTGSGKNLTFDYMDSNSEKYLLMLPEEKRTRNAELIARNLKLEVNGKYEKVTNFRMFSIKDMQDIRRIISANDPVYTGNIILEHPSTGVKETYNILGNPDFFGFMS